MISNDINVRQFFILHKLLCSNKNWPQKSLIIIKKMKNNLKTWYKTTASLLKK